MKINKLNDEFFLDFASYIMGYEVRYHMTDMTFARNENSVKMKFYVGGEFEDGRSFLFQDTNCLFKDYSHYDQRIENLGYKWMKYIIEYADEITDKEKEELVNDYNNSIEYEIQDYAARRREALII